MKTLYLLLILLFLGSVSAEEKEYSLSKARIAQLKMLKTKSITKWPKEAGHLYQGLHYKLDMPVQTKAGFEAAIKLVPERLKGGFYELKTIEEIDGWFVVEAGISVIAIEKGSNVLRFGYQW